MSVVFVNPPILLPEVFAHYPMFSSLGMLSNAAFLRAKGENVQIVDAFTAGDNLLVENQPSGLRLVGCSIERLCDATESALARCGGTAVIVVSVTMFSDLNRPSETLIQETILALQARFGHCKIGLADLYVCGMNYFPYDVKKIMQLIPSLAFILLGEGEPNLYQLISRLSTGEDLGGIERLCYRGANRDIVLDSRAPLPVQELDSIPLPAFDLLDMDAYFRSMSEAICAELVHEYHVVERLLPFMTSRSCPYRCNFCTNQVLGLPWRAHSVEYVRQALRELRDKYGVERLLLLDDNINVDETRFRDLVQMFADEKMPWDAVNGYRADKLDREMVRAIKAAGNTKITVSAESGDPQLLKAVIKKGLKLGSVVALAKICEEEQIPLQVHYIVGVPGETKAQMNQTLEFATMLYHEHGAWPLLQHAIPFPGTQLFRDCEQNGYFVKHPFDVSGTVLEVESIIKTPEFLPGEVVRMKRNGQHLHLSMQKICYVDVETRCDNKCLSCHCTQVDRSSISGETIRQKLSRARFLGAKELFLGGGEPSMRADLPEIVTEAKSLGFLSVALVTNAHGLASPDRAERILDAGVDRLVIDLFGPEPLLHDQLAGREKAFAFTVAGVKAAISRNLGIDVVIPILRSNLHALQKTIRVAQAMQAKAIHLRLPSPDSPALAAGEIVPWEDLRGELDDALSLLPRGVITIQGAPLCLMPKRPGALSPLPPWELTRARAFRVKHQVCRACVGYILCGGFFREEFEPHYGAMAAALGH